MSLPTPQISVFYYYVVPAFYDVICNNDWLPVVNNDMVGNPMTALLKKYLLRCSLCPLWGIYIRKGIKCINGNSV